MKKALFASQEGSILPILAGFVVVAMALAFIALDYTRYLVASEKLRTAGEAAAVAGARSAVRHVRIRVNRGMNYGCDWDRWGHCVPRCKVDCGTIIVEGKESELVDKGGYSSYFCECGEKSYEILDRWVIDENSNAQLAARILFNENIPGEMTGEEGGEASISGITTYLSENQKKDPRYPSVVVKTQGRVKTLLLGFLHRLFPDKDFTYLDASHCSQGGSYYRDPDNGKWSRSAADACD